MKNPFTIKQILVASLLSAIFIIILCCKLFFNNKDDEVLPIIYAEKKPFKIKPLDPGGMVVDNMDKTIYESFNENKNKKKTKEHILPSPEQPINLNNLNNQLDSETDKKLEDEAKKPRVITNIVADYDNSKDQTNQKKETKLNKNLYKIQLGFYYSKEDALKYWESLRIKFHKQLANLEPIILDKYINQKGKFYNLQAGYISDKMKVKIICKHLSSQDHICHLVEQEK